MDSTDLTGPDSIAWRTVSDARALLIAPRALVLQVAHPVIGGGVDDRSSFRTDPYRRLDRSLAMFSALFVGPDPDAAGRRIRRMHTHINGTDWAGRHYDAFDPEAYAWVIATSFDTAEIACKLWGPRLDAHRTEQLYRGWWHAGLRCGVEPSQLPERLADFRDWYRTVRHERLEHNHVVDQVLSQPSAVPGWWPLPSPLFTAASRPLFEVAHTISVGSLPRSTRRLFGLRWGARQRAAFVAAVVALRAANVVPRPHRLHPWARAALDA